MPASSYDLTIPSESLRRTTRAWLLLALASLVGAGLYSLLLVLARTPTIQHMFPLIDFFRTALVVHVNLSVLIWLLSIAGVFWSLACTDDRPRWDRVSFLVAATGTAIVALSPIFGATEPLMNNYVPVLRHPVFYVGMGLFTTGIFLHLLRCTLSWHPFRRAQRSAATASEVLRGGSRLAAGITGAAVLAFLASMAGLPDDVGGLAYFEFLFWGGGHILQFTHTLLMMLAWIVLCEASGYRFSLSPRTTASFLIILALPVVTVPYIYLAHDVNSYGHRFAFTELMKWGGLSCLPLGIAVLASFRGAVKPAGEARYLRSALLSSLALFATGGVLGFIIAQLNLVVPAHYHGTTVGVTIAFMGVAYYLLPRLGFGAVPQRMAFWQPIVYGSGQLMHIAGLVWSGGYGVQRKTPGIELSLDQLGEIAGLGLMGLGGLVSVTGGLLFLVVCWQSIRGRIGSA